jgi:2-methylisocitrate lyase-like PEP mutase family enzyme
VFAHVREVTQATTIPLSVDLENGYSAEPERAATAIVGAAEAGAVGGSIEDWAPDIGIYPLAQAVERVEAACAAAHALDFPFTVTARAENLIRGVPDLDDTIERLLAYEQAGADVLFAPGLRTPNEIRTVCTATSKPVNVLAHAKVTMREIVDAGAQRVSVGGALTWTAVNALVAAAERLRDEGDFSVLGSSARIQELFGA